MTVVQRLALPIETISSIMSVGRRDVESVFEVVDGYAILCAHGNDNGLVRYNGTLQSTRLVLKDLVDNNYNELVDNNVTIIYTLSCYGGLQGTYTYRGITITSIHQETAPIIVSDYVAGYITMFSKEDITTLASATVVVINININVRTMYVVVVVVDYSVCTAVIFITAPRPPPS